MTYSSKLALAAGLLVLWGWAGSASAVDYGILACSQAGSDGPVVTIAQFSDDNGDPVPRGPVFEVDPIGLPCASALAMARQAEFDIVAQNRAVLCETGICPNPPPRRPACQIWDITGSTVQGVQGLPPTAVVGCHLTAEGGPTIISSQVAGTGPVIDILGSAVGRPCSTVAAEALSAGGEIIGRNIVPFSLLMGRDNPAGPVTGPIYTPLVDSIVYEMIRD